MHHRLTIRFALNAVHASGVRWRFSSGIGPSKSAVMTFDPLRGRPDCCVHHGGVPLPLVQQYRNLGVVLSPTLSWRPHVDFIRSRGDRLFHQASAWCLGEGRPLSFSSSVFVTYVLSSSCFGLEFICDDPPALQQPNLALRRWCRHLLGWPSASAVSVMLCTLPLGALSRFSGACVLSTTPPLRSLPVCSGSGYMVTLVRVCSPLFLPPAPCPRGYLSWLSALVTPPVALP